jgi:predicted RND superfamily exporter protein
MISALFEYLNQRFEKLPNATLQYRWIIIFGFLLSSAFMLFNIVTKFNMDMSFETMFKQDDPIRTTLNNFRHQFGSDDGLYMVYEAKDGDVFSEKSIATIAKLHKELDDARVARGDKASELNRIEKIDSLYNIRLQKVEGDTLISQKLLATDYPQTKQEREAKRAIAITQDTFRLAYYSDNFRYGGIRVKTDFGTIPKNEKIDEAIEEDLLSDDFTNDFANTSEYSDELNNDNDYGDALGELVYDKTIAETIVEYQATQMPEYLDFMEDVRAITSKPDYDHFEFHYSGNAAMMEFATETFKQGSALIGAMLLIFIVLLWALFRSFSAVLWPISVIAGSTIWAVGFFSLIEITLSNLVMLTVMLIMAVGIAACVHVLSTYGIYRKEGQAHATALATAYRQTGVPIFLTTATTMAGMASLVVSDIPQIATFGLLSAFGVFVSFWFIMLLLPVCLEYWRPYTKESIRSKTLKSSESDVNLHWLKPFLDKIPMFVEKHAKTIVAGYIAAFALFIYGASIVKVDTNITESTREGSMIRVAAHIIDGYMMGGQTMEVILDFGEANAVKQPDVLKAIEAFQSHILETYPNYIVKSFSIADYVKDTNKAMNEDRDEFKVIPDDARMAAQLLYMFNNSNAEDRRSLVGDDYSNTHITIQLKNAGTYEYSPVFKSLDNDIEKFFGGFSKQYENTVISSTGSLPMMMNLLDKMNWAQIKSFGLAIAIISLFLIVSLNSFKGGLISMLPNILPSISTFGIMGLVGTNLDTDTLIVAPLIIGIAVDDTIHFMSHYRDAWFRTGDMRESLKETIFEVGQAVTFTTIILATGFAVLVFSDFLGIAKIGGFGALAILVALSCDLLLLPASIILLKPDLGRKSYIANLEKNSLSAT